MISESESLDSGSKVAGVWWSRACTTDTLSPSQPSFEILELSPWSGFPHASVGYHMECTGGEFLSIAPQSIPSSCLTLRSGALLSS